MVVDDGGQPSLSFFFGQGNAQFSSRVAWPLGFDTGEHPAVADFNHDGHDDLATAEHQGSDTTLTLFLGNPGGFGGPVQSVIQPLSNIDALDVANFDSDGNADVQLNPPSGPNVSVPMDAPSDGTVTGQIALTQPPFSPGTVKVKVSVSDNAKKGQSPLKKLERTGTITIE